MITLDNYKFTFDASGGIVVIRYMSDNPITEEAISSTPDWIEAEIQKDSANEGNITLTIAVNDENMRSTSLEFSAYDRIEARTTTATIDINQLAAQEVVGIINIQSITLDNTTTSSPVKMDEFEHTVKVNLYTSLIQSINVINTSSWVSLYSQGDNEYIFNVVNNPSDARNTTITFEAFDILGNRLTVDVQFNQAQHYEYTFYFYVKDSYSKAQESVQILEVESENVQSYEVTDYPDWISIEDYDSDTITIKYYQNTIYKDRIGTITYNIIDERGHEHEFESRVQQQASIFSGQFPTWQDIFVQIPTTDEDRTNITYSVSIYNDELKAYEQIYKGNAVYLNNENPSINLTPIVRDYVKDNINITDESGLLQKTPFIDAIINTDEEPDQTLVARVYYYYDYSFDKDFKFTRNMPILDYFDVRQDLFLSFLNLSGETNNVTISAGRRQLRLTFDKPGIFHNKRAYYEGNVLITAPDKQMVLHSKPTCAKYAIYYLNPLGGWDQLVIEGKVVKSIKLDNKSYKRNFDNNTIEFENKHYLKNLTTSYKLTTCYLTDEQAKLMPNLIKSTKAYLCELDTNTYIPVLINNNSVDIKTYRNQGRKMFTYTIEVQESQNKFIK